MLGVEAPDCEAESELLTDSVADCEPVSHGVGVKEGAPVEEDRSLKEEMMLGETVLDSVPEIECREGEADGDSVVLTVDTSDLVSREEADWDALSLEEGLLLAVKPMVDDIDTDKAAVRVLNPEGVLEEETVPQDEEDSDGEPLEERLALGVEHVVGTEDPVCEKVCRGQNVADEDGDCAVLKVSVGVAVPQDVAETVIVPLGERLALDVEPMLGVVETECVAEGESWEGEADGDCVTLSVYDGEAVPHREKRGDRLLREEKLPHAVERVVGDVEGEGVAEKELAPERDCSGEPVSLDEAVKDKVPLGERLPLDVGHAAGELESEGVPESETQEGEADGDSVVL